MDVLTYDTDHGYWTEMLRENVSCVFISCKFSKNDSSMPRYDILMHCLFCKWFFEYLQELILTSANSKITPTEEKIWFA